MSEGEALRARMRMVAAALDAPYASRSVRDYQVRNPPRKLRYYRELVERTIGPRAPRRIHDVGCAFGLFLASLDDGWQICGSDVSTHAVIRARSSLPRGEFLVAEAHAAHFAGPFGAVTAWDVAEHVPNVEALAAAVVAQLHDDGCFVFAVPVYDGLAGPLRRRLDRDPTHVHRWSRRRWLHWASKHFRIVEWAGVFRALLPGGVYVHLVTRGLRRHAPAIVVACRKRPGLPAHHAHG